MCVILDTGRLLYSKIPTTYEWHEDLSDLSVLSLATVVKLSVVKLSTLLAFYNLADN